MEKLETKRHSLSHLMAAAIKEFWPQAHLAIGPAIDNGFYYDIDFGETKILETDLKNIEKKMAHLAKQNLKFERADMEISAALKTAQEEGNPYKTELISALKPIG